MQLEDLDFIKMVEDLNLQFDESELAEVEQSLNSKISGRVSTSLGESRYWLVLKLNYKKLILP